MPVKSCFLAFSISSTSFVSLLFVDMRMNAMNNTSHVIKKNIIQIQ